MLIIFLNALIILLAGSLMLGLVKPVWVIWWMYRQNRIRVIRLYGGLLLLALCARLFVSLF